MDRVAEVGKAHGVRRAVPLPVSAPFHCALMQPAADAMAEALEKTTLKVPAVPVIANVSAAPVAEPEQIRKLLVEQVTATVRWRESIEAMKQEGVARIFELGAGKVLAGLVKRIDREIEASSVGTPEDIEAALKALG
jgi:[acyl-carrier-protein] S-malonyltransferase